MKTLSALVLLLTMIVGGLGYIEYRQSTEIADLESEVSYLQVDVTVQTAVIVSQQSALSKSRKREAIVEGVVFKIVDFLSHLDIETEPSSGNGPKS